MRSEVFGDVDSGDVRWFKTTDDRNVVRPGRGTVGGAQGAIGLSIQLWENDRGNPDKVREVTETTLDLAGVSVLPWVGQVPRLVRDQLIALFSDDLMGLQTLHIRVERLGRPLPDVGDGRPVILHFHGRSGDLPFDVAGGPDYDLYLRLSRTA